MDNLGSIPACHMRVINPEHHRYGPNPARQKKIEFGGDHIPQCPRLTLFMCSGIIPGRTQGDHLECQVTNLFSLDLCFNFDLNFCLCCCDVLGSHKLCWLMFVYLWWSHTLWNCQKYRWPTIWLTLGIAGPGVELWVWSFHHWANARSQAPSQKLGCCWEPHFEITGLTAQKDPSQDTEFQAQILGLSGKTP